jgi:hypothetical protein
MDRQSLRVIEGESDVADVGKPPLAVFLEAPV